MPRARGRRRRVVIVRNRRKFENLNELAALVNLLLSLSLAIAITVAIEVFLVVFSAPVPSASFRANHDWKNSLRLSIGQLS